MNENEDDEKGRKINLFQQLNRTDRTNIFSVESPKAGDQ